MLTMEPQEPEPTEVQASTIADMGPDAGIDATFLPLLLLVAAIAILVAWLGRERDPDRRSRRVIAAARRAAATAPRVCG